jgi:4-methyl-5(b-hydroxyethyl)-thiazole monophosphate biosynthesis
MKTLALFYPGCIEFEIMLACEILNSKFPVEIITPDGADHTGSNGMTFKAAGSIANLDTSAYKTVLIPGGDPGVLIGNVELSQALQRLHANGATLGAICAGPIILDQAGLLHGHQIAHGYKGSQLQFILDNGFFKNTKLTDEAFIVKDKIVTARPDSFIDFAVEIAALSGAIDSSKKHFWKEYYRGKPN